ncbi:MAG: hypothetical protein RI893_1654 [Pseudomonadota bacterium]
MFPQLAGRLTTGRKRHQHVIIMAHTKSKASLYPPTKVKGYKDNLLKELKRRAKIIAVAFFEIIDIKSMILSAVMFDFNSTH